VLRALATKKGDPLWVGLEEVKRWRILLLIKGDFEGISERRKERQGRGSTVSAQK